jgi:hypothetical protein
MDQIARAATGWGGVFAALPAWLPPPDVSVRSTPCGEAFDAVRVNERLGAYSLELLAGRSRGVIADRRDGVLYWLIRPGAAVGWDMPCPGVRVGVLRLGALPRTGRDPIRALDRRT